MKNFLVLFLMVISLRAVRAQDNFLEFGDVNFGRNFKEKSRWIFMLGQENLNYKTEFPSYNGVHQKIEGEDSQLIHGTGLYFGRDFYLTSGISFAVYVGGSYTNMTKKIIGKAAKDIDVDFSTTRTTHKVSSYQALASFNYLFDYKIVDIQPFVEFGAGVGSAGIEKEYFRLGLSSETNGSEKYKVLIDEEFRFSRISIGVNFISYKGLMSYLKLSSVMLFKSKRNTEGLSNLLGQVNDQIIKRNEEDLSETVQTHMVSIGIGRYF